METLRIYGFVFLFMGLVLKAFGPEHLQDMATNYLFGAIGYFTIILVVPRLVDFVEARKQPAKIKLTK